MAALSTKTQVKKSQAHSDYLIIKPRVTEKSNFQSAFRQYVFDVAGNANKSEVRKVVEDIYKVNVEKVMIVNIHSKSRRLGRTVGKKPGYKKAIVVLKEGQSIDFTPNQKK